MATSGMLPVSPSTDAWSAGAGSSSPPVVPAVSLPPEDTHRVTGEEEERSVYTGAALHHS